MCNFYVWHVALPVNEKMPTSTKLVILPSTSHLSSILVAVKKSGRLMIQCIGWLIKELSGSVCSVRPNYYIAPTLGHSAESGSTSRRPSIPAPSIKSIACPRWSIEATRSIGIVIRHRRRITLRYSCYAVSAVCRKILSAPNGAAWLGIAPRLANRAFRRSHQHSAMGCSKGIVAFVQRRRWSGLDRGC